MKRGHGKYDVVPCGTEKANIPQSELMSNGIIAKFPSIWLIVGRSGCGKSTVVQFLLSDDRFMGQFHDEVTLFSPTGKLDDVAKQLELDDDHIITDPVEDDILAILDRNEKEIERVGIDAAASTHKHLFIFDDIISTHALLTSPAFLRLACMGRHFLAGALICSQSYTKIPRAVRLQARTLLFFPSNQDEVDYVVHDYCPPHTSSESFRRLVETATSGPHDFLHINMNAPVATRFRRCFKNYFDLSESNRRKYGKQTKRKPGHAHKGVVKGDKRYKTGVGAQEERKTRSSKQTAHHTK